MTIKTAAAGLLTIAITLGSAASAAAAPSQAVAGPVQPPSQNCIVVTGSPTQPDGTYCLHCINITAIFGHPGGRFCEYVLQP